MKKVFNVGLLLVLVLGMVGIAMPASASTPQTDTILVGAENVSKGVTISSFFPHTVRIHVGDTITWTINSHEPHTVTFLAGASLQPIFIPAPVGMASPLQINPMAFFTSEPAGGQYDGSSYANSGFMSLDPGAGKTFSLTFTHIGSFDYICYIHGEMMSGTIDVVGAGTAVPTPAQVQAQGQAELKAAWLSVPTVMAKAVAQIVPPVKNPDGTMTRTFTMGYESGNIALLRFFPSQQTVMPGDTVVWKMSSLNMAPHTVTFFNGTPDQPLFIIAIGQNGPVALVNPAILFPSPAVMQGEPLNGTEFFNSGIMLPGAGGPFSLKVGNVSGTLNFECALHDTAGMVGSLFVVPPSGN
ncbi:MAG: plastocyanin/azurin family copper-binding protein [Acidobacteriaceae bacterium]